MWVRGLQIENARIVADTGVIDHGWLTCRDGAIAEVAQGDPPQRPEVEHVDAAGLTLLPGFIDLHVHGGAGAEAMDAAPESLRTMARFYAEHGVTAFLATTWTDARQRITAALRCIAGAVGAQPDGATLLGAHLEGPYLNASRGGAQNTEYIRRADRDEAAEWLDLGAIRLAAVAPEFEENRWFIEACVQRGIVVSAAHTAATYEQMRRAVELGVRQTTHTYNAMTGLHHREPGTLGAAMILPQLNCELIADNIHVHPVAMAILTKLKGVERIILISDAIRGAGIAEGEYQIDERTVVIRDGAVRLPDGTLAGSTLTMERALANFMAATGFPVEAAWQASSLNAARALHVDDQRGSIALGKRADVVLVDSSLNVALTVAEGRVVFRRGV